MNPVTDVRVEILEAYAPMDYVSAVVYSDDGGGDRFITSFHFVEHKKSSSLFLPL
jgi:hypothetical protein